jgi:indolepyruvate ferredoxin oxidoreductase
LGRRAAHDPQAVREAAGVAPVPAPTALASATAAAFLGDGKLTHSLDESLKLRSDFLVEYQDAAYARQYTDFVAKVRGVEAERTPGLTGLSEAVARYLFKLMAYKDEYEVARLYTSGEFLRQVERQFDGDYRLKFHLAPPLLARRDENGQLIKREFGPWVFTAFKWLAKLRKLRGGPLDLFGYTQERRTERQLIVDYFKTIDTLLPTLDRGNVALAAEIAAIPEHIRGYGHVKEDHLHKAKAREAELLVQWNNPLRIVQVA